MSDNSWIFRHWKRDTHSAKKIQLYYQWASHSQIFFFPHFCWQFILLNEYLFSPIHIGIFYAFPKYPLISIYYLYSCAIVLYFVTKLCLFMLTGKRFNKRGGRLCKQREK